MAHPGTSIPKKWSVAPQNHLFAKWVHTKMAHTSLETIQSGNEGRTMQNCSRRHTGGLQDLRKNNGTWAAQTKSEGQHIHGAFHTRRVHTSCKMGAHQDGTYLSPDHSIGKDYAKMKAKPCKIVENTLEDPRKNHNMEWHKPRVKVKTYMEFSYTRQVHTSCKWGGCHTKMAHPAFSRCGG